MKTIIVMLLVVIAVMGLFMSSMYVTLETKTLELQKQERYSFEIDKACEGHRMYLMNILDEHKIEYFN